jgi:glucose-6-phosphate 1-epimerase
MNRYPIRIHTLEMRPSIPILPFMNPAQSIDSLATRFSMPGVTIDLGEGGLPRIRIRNSLCAGELYLHGAHLTGFRPANYEPVLWMSIQSAYQAGKAIRGGVPICFPWFGPSQKDPSVPIHGFARTIDWELVDVGAQPTGEINVILKLPASPDFARYGYENVETYFAVLFGASLEMGFHVRNLGTKPFNFEAALHSYFVIGDVTQIRVRGLQGASYLDKTRGMQRFTEASNAIELTEETDRVYDSTTPVTIEDPLMRRKIVVDKLGSGSTVLWNAWPKKAAEIGLAEGEWQRYVCVETAAVGANSITLAPGQTHSLGANIRLENA